MSNIPTPSTPNPATPVVEPTPGATTSPKITVPPVQEVTPPPAVEPTKKA